MATTATEVREAIVACVPLSGGAHRKGCGRSGLLLLQHELEKCELAVRFSTRYSSYNVMQRQLAGDSAPAFLKKSEPADVSMHAAAGTEATPCSACATQAVSSVNTVLLEDV